MRFFSRLHVGCYALFLAALPSPALRAATSTWTGAAGADFAAPANWSPAPPVDSLTADLAAFSGTPTTNQPALTVSRAVSGLVFGTPSGGWTLSASDPAQALSLGASGVSATAQTSGASTVSAGLLISANQTWAVGGGSALRFSGALRAGASFNSTLPGQLVIGGSNAGEIILDPASGRSAEIYTTVASAAAVQVNQRLSLGSPGGSSAAQNILFNSVGAGLRVSSTGVLTVNSGVWRTNDLGSNNTNAFTGVLNITGGSLVAGGARYLGQFNGAIGTTVNLSGGSFIVTGGGHSLVNSGHLGLGAHGANTPSGTINFNVTGGLLDVALGSGNFPANSTFTSGIANAALSLGGTANTTVLFNQSGGSVRVAVTAGTHVFTGASNNNTYTNLSIGSAYAGNHAAYTLAGGDLAVAGTIQGVPVPGGTSNFNLIGGTLSAASVDVTSLGNSPTATASANQTFASASIGTLVNRGTTVAPGGRGFSGRTLVIGSYQALADSTLAVDIGGSTPANAFQSTSEFHDTLSATGNVTLGGNLAFTFLPGYVPPANATFTIISCNGTLSGSFVNAPSGSRLISSDGRHTLALIQTSSAVTLGQYAPVVTPIITSTSTPSVVAEGDAVLIGVDVSSLGPVTYEWRRDGVLIPGAIASTLSLLNFQTADAGLYEVTVRNAAGSVTRSFFVRITVPPSASSVVVDAGASRAFSASSGAVSYQWILDGATVGSAASYAYSPIRREVGIHWLRVVETYADASTLTRQWCVRVRIPEPASAIAYYVSPAGSDGASGTLAAPFASLEKARDTIRLLTSTQRAGGVTVFLRGGVYRRGATFSLTSQDSGTEAAPILYAAYPGEIPIITTSRVISSSQWSPLAASQQGRLPAGIDPARVWELDVTGNPRANAFPDIFNEWMIFNSFRSTLNGGSLELFYKGERMRISRYPNADLTDDTKTANLLMDGVAQGTAITKDPATNTYSSAPGYLNNAGNYTPSGGGAIAVGGAFCYPAIEATRVARWAAAINNGGVWLAGFWRVPWQVNGVRIKLIDTTNRVIGLATNPSNANEPLVPNGIGDKYTRPVGSKKEPWWAVNLLEELDQPGEWCVDFNRKRIYFLMDRAGAPADGEVELSDASASASPFSPYPLFQLNGVSDVRIQGITFRRHLGVNVQILNGARNLVRGCAFIQSGNMAVDINGGTDHGVLSSDFEKLASGGVFLRGGSAPIPAGSTVPSSVTPANSFAVNNRFRSFGETVRVYQAAIDAGYGGPIGSWSVTPAVAGMRIASNYISTSPHAGILWHGYQNIIEYNEVTDFTRISQDFGAIYRYGPNQDNNTIIRYNHIYSSPLGEGIYNDADHVRTPIYGNVVNLKTPSTATRGFGFWTNTNTAAGAAVAGIPTTLQIYNNIAVNSRSNYSLHSSAGAPTQNNISYRKLASDFLWYRITVNTTTNTQSYAASNAATLSLSPNTNIGYSVDPGFIDYANDDLRLRPDAQAYRDLPGFSPIPLEMSGLHNDETRSAANRVWTPFIVTNSATSVGANSATFTGTLVYPQFGANATVRVYWGTTDGGTDPAAWDNVAVLGQPGSGYLAHARSDLAPATRYFFRFHAINAAGEHWAERTNSTTTFQSNVVPDTTGPVITTPASLEVEASSASGAYVNFEVSAEDALSGTCPASASPASGSLFPIGVTTVTVTASDAAGNVSTSTFTVTVKTPSIPAPWSISQINPYAGVAPGSIIASSPSAFQIIGSGGASTGGTTGDLWTGNNDSFTYVSQPWSGDGVFTARLASFTSTDVSAKAGIIFRETTSAGSRYSAVYMIRNNGGAVLFQHKTATSGSTSNVNFFNGSVTNRGIPEWIRLVRQGDAFGTFYSADGVTWTELGSARLNVMGGASLSVGFCVVPRTGGSTAAASFDNISFLSPVQSWRQAHFGVTSDSGLAAFASDPDGDGQTNLLEYALGTTPTSAASASLLVPSTTLLEGSTAPHLELRFNRVADPLLSYAVEAADNLASSWTVIWTSTGAANVAGPVTVSDVVELVPDRPRRFLRLRVTLP